MSQILDNPPLGLTLDEELLGGFGGFPDRLFLISVGGDKYACNNATLSDGQKINGLASFPSADDATTYMGLLQGLSGDLVGKSFEEAREIAISKPVLMALFLFVAGKIVEVHYVR
jgi:hypothetical protein